MQKEILRKLFDQRLDENNITEVLDRLENRKPDKIVNKSAFYLTVLFNQLQNYRLPEQNTVSCTKAHNFTERSDTDWDALELKLLQRDVK